MLSDTAYLMLALILFGPLFYHPREEETSTRKLPEGDASSS